MTMTKKLSKTGTSYSLIIDKSIMQLLSITPETLLEIKTNGTSLIITPIENNLEEKNREELFEKSLNKSLNKFGKVYERLAK